MSAELAFIFDNIFTDMFKYDAKYNELSFKQSNVDIKQYPVNIRRIWYKFYPQLISKYRKLEKVYDKKHLMNDIETDESLPFIPMDLIDSQYLKDREFHKLFEEDYQFRQLTDRSDRKHFRFHYVVNYDMQDFKGWNINIYLQQGLLKIKDLKIMSENVFDIIDKCFIVQYMNKYNAIRGWQRFVDLKKPEFIESQETEQLDPELIHKIVDELIVKYHSNTNKQITTERLAFISKPERYALFDKSVESIATHIINNVKNTYAIETEEGDEAKKYVNVAEHNINDLIKCHKFNSKTIESLFAEPWAQVLNKTRILSLIKQNPDLTDMLLSYPKIDVVADWFAQQIANKAINKDNFNEYWEKWGNHIHKGSKGQLCGAWIQYHKEEPPLPIYVSPNTPCETYDCSPNRIWAKYVNPATVPKEMTSINYYEYMIASKGRKRNPNHTTMYTFFSNTDENKIIFCRSDVELFPPARPRYSIEIDYDEIKPFLHEELDTNGICSFTHLTKDDWAKVAGGNDTFDVVCFSEMKNIYRERTPLKDVLNHFITAIALQFDTEPDVIE